MLADVMVPEAADTAPPAVAREALEKPHGKGLISR
jgi:hypothetical protein